MQPRVGDLAAGKEPHQGYIAQPMLDPLRFGRGRAKVRAAPPGAADVDSSGDG